MTARAWLMSANTSSAALVGLLALLLWQGWRVDRWDANGLVLVMFVAPAVLAAALATAWVGWSALARQASAATSALLLALKTVLAAFALYFLLVTLVVWPWTVLMVDPGFSEGLGGIVLSGFFVGLLALVFGLLLGLLPALLLCWPISAHALRLRSAELRAGERFGAPRGVSA